MNLQVIIQKFSFILLIFGLNGNRNCTSQQKNIKLISGSKQQAIQARTISTSNPTDNPKFTNSVTKTMGSTGTATQQDTPNSNDKDETQMGNWQSKRSDGEPGKHNQLSTSRHSINKSPDAHSEQNNVNLDMNSTAYLKAKKASLEKENASLEKKIANLKEKIEGYTKPTTFWDGNTWFKFAKNKEEMEIELAIKVEKYDTNQKTLEQCKKRLTGGDAAQLNCTKMPTGDS